MKKNLWIWAMAALSMAACTSEETPAPQVTDSDWVSPDGRVVVQLGAESTATVGVSRAPITGTNITALKDLGIFALNRGAQFTEDILEEETWLGDNDCLLMNVKAQGANSTPEAETGTPVDPLDPTVNTGKKISLYKSDGTGEAGAVYYYPLQGNQNYDFYGYQPREESTVSVDAAGKLQVSMTLDGDKDLITGIHNPNGDDYKGYAPQVSEADLYDTEHKVTDGTIVEPQSTLSGTLDGYNAKYIRKIKYHNWIVDQFTAAVGENASDYTIKEKKPFVPKLEFVHRLTKLNFQIITAKAQSGTGDNQGNDREEAADLKVKDIKLLHVPTAATLTIEPDMTLAFAGDATLDMIKDETATSVWNGEEIIPQVYADNATYTSAGYLMVPEVGEDEDVTYPEYQIQLVVIASDTNGQPKEQTITLDLSGNKFLAGKSYNLQIALYAMQEVEVSATLTDWEQAPDVYIPVE